MTGRGRLSATDALRMIVDWIVKALSVLMLWSPLLLPAVIFITLVTVLVTHQRKGSLGLALCVSVVVGVFGILVVEPIKLGGWNWQFIGLPFLFCKWMLIGFLGAWPLFACRKHVPWGLLVAQVVFGMFFLVLISLTIADHTYVSSVAHADTRFWERVLRTNEARLPTYEYRQHLSSFGREVVSHHLQYHKNTEPEMLHVLADILPGGVRAIADQKTIDRLLAERALREARAVDEVLLSQLARNPGVPADILLRLSDDPNVTVRRELSLNPAAPPEILLKLIADGERLLAKEQRVPERSRDLWAISNTITIIRNAKANLAERLDPTINKDVGQFGLGQLAKDADVAVRRSVARNPNAPTDLLLQLTHDTDGEVVTRAFEGLGRSPKTPPDLLQQLARDSSRNHRIQTAVASNPKASLSVLTELVRVREYETRTAAIRTLAAGDAMACDTLREWLREADNFDLRALAREKRLPKWVYINLARTTHYEARQSAFERLSNVADITVRELSDLLEGTDTRTKDYLAQSSRCSPLLLEILVKDADPTRRQSAVTTLAHVREYGVYDK